MLTALLHKLTEIVAGVLVTLSVFVALAMVLVRAQDLVAHLVGHRIIDRGDEWTCVSALLLLVVPVISGYLIAMILRERLRLRRAAH
jgi:hypothetical protein